MRTGDLYQRYYGLYVGKVVSVDDPQKTGRIRLKCDQFADSDTDPLWAVVARPAGGATSVFFTPNEGDQVVFGYQVGDVNGPVVLGYAHNSGDQKPPQEVDAATKKHGIVTSIGSVVFDENAKQIVVTLNDPKSTITMNDKGITLEASKVVLKAVVAVGDENPTHPIPLGDKLIQWLQAHTHPTAMGPSGPPIPVPAIPDLQLVLSTKHNSDS
jgi:phage baseplate assembly protein gpV